METSATAIFFPNFSLIFQTFQKIRMGKTEVVLAVSKWPAQPSYNSFQVILTGIICGDHTQGEFTSTTKTTATALLVAKTNTSVRKGVRKVFLSILIQSFANDAVEILIAS